MKILRLPLVLCFVAAAGVMASTGFPSEEQLKTELRQGMTPSEATRKFGQPGSRIELSDQSFLYRFRAPIGYLTEEQEGYVGFELHFVEGTLHDWRSLPGNPSFALLRPPPILRWYGSILLLFGLGAALFMAFRRKHYAADEDKALLQTYVARRILTRRLPEFSFISHETTMQEVVDKMGPPSRTKNLSLDTVVGSEKTAAHNVLGMSIPLAEYDLPYGAAAIVMPEYPCNPQNKIRATFYRVPQPDEEFPS
jgi:hypothetical protein